MINPKNIGHILLKTVQQLIHNNGWGDYYRVFYRLNQAGIFPLGLGDFKKNNYEKV